MDYKTMIVLLALIAGFTTVIVTNEQGVELTTTHYCESRMLKMYCARVTAQYCSPSLETNLGSKKCTEGWKQIPFLETVKSSSGVIHCTYKEGCK